MARLPRVQRPRTGGFRRPGPAARELTLLFTLFAAYESSRSLATDDGVLAAAHARSIAVLESRTGLGFEHSFNDWLTSHRFVEVAASFWYASLHYVVTPIVLVLLWRRLPQLYRRVRSVLVVATAGALGCYLAYPVAPPRLLPGFVDTLRATSDVGWWGGEASAPKGLGAATNQLAAMPSMHVGWALWCGAVLAVVSRRVWVRRLAWAYPVMTTLVVVATANHWTLDAVGGVAMMAAAAGVVAWWNPQAIAAGMARIFVIGPVVPTTPMPGQVQPAVVPVLVEPVPPAETTLPAA